MKNIWNTIPKATFGLLALALLLFASGCSQEGCTDPLSVNYDPEATSDDGSCVYSTATINLMVHHMVGTEAYSTASNYVASNGRQYKFTTARFYMSGIGLEQADGSTLDLNKYLQIVAGSSNYTLGNVEPASFHAISFNVGVDSAANHRDPNTFPIAHALSASSSTFDHWSWNSGYIFLKIEGLADTTTNMTGTVNGPFEMHIGGDAFLRQLNLPSHFDASSGSSSTIHMNIDWGKALDGVDLQNATTHTMDNMPLANTVITNFLSAITVD